MDAEQIFEELDLGRGLPTAAIRAAQANRDSMVPVLLSRIGELSPSYGKPLKANALFFAFHLLGEWREKPAYRPLARFLRLPDDILEPILSDAKTETSHRVMAAVFDGDPGPLCEIIRDANANEYIRSRMLQTIAMLTRRGDLPRAESALFLEACYSQLEPRQGCYVWQGWVDAVAWLGLGEMKDLVQQAFARGSIEPGWLSFNDFKKYKKCCLDADRDESAGAVEVS